MQHRSLEFVSDQLVDYRRLHMLNIFNDHSRFCRGQVVDLSISGARLARNLDELGERLGPPEGISFDSVPEGTSRAMLDWSEHTGMRLRFIEPGMLSASSNSTPRQRAVLSMISRQLHGSQVAGLPVDQRQIGRAHV